MIPLHQFSQAARPPGQTSAFDKIAAGCAAQRDRLMPQGTARNTAGMSARDKIEVGLNQHVQTIQGGWTPAERFALQIDAEGKPIRG